MIAWTLNYVVTADFLPFRKWVIAAESESEARMELVRMLGIPYEQTDATFAKFCFEFDKETEGEKK